MPGAARVGAVIYVQWVVAIAVEIVAPIVLIAWLLGDEMARWRR